MINKKLNFEKPLKTSQVLSLLEKLSISGFGYYNRIIKFRFSQDYYKFVRSLNLKTKKEYIGNADYPYYKLETNYCGWIFKADKSK